LYIYYVILNSVYIFLVAAFFIAESYYNPLSLIQLFNPLYTVLIVSS